MKVQQFYNKNQFIITDGAKKVFQSYDSTISEITKNGTLFLGGDWNFSHTTLKHLYLFLEDYKNEIKAEQYKEIFSKGFSTSKNKKAFLQNLIDKKIIKVTL